jgi:hypothetical protein
MWAAVVAAAAASDRSPTDPITCRGALERRDASDRRVRAATVAHGRQWSPAVAIGSDEPQVMLLQLTRQMMMQAGDSDCGPEDHEG